MATIDAILNDLVKLPLRAFPLSFTDAGLRGFCVGMPTLEPRLPNVTAVILNWSRLVNVIHIASILCGPWLDDTISEVIVWNNSPQKLSKEMFSSPRCNTQKLKIVNSPENLYFYARFLACTKVSTPYCFIQDDDYIILPEIVKTLRTRIEESQQTGIYLLPPLEHLSSRLRTTVTSSGIHTSFAWLGYGAIISRQRILSFVSLLHDDSLSMTMEEVKMADNYFTILSNELPEIWFDQGIELGGGQPFTVGDEGNERNRMHIGNACRYLDEIVAHSSRIAASSNSRAISPDFVKVDKHLFSLDDHYVNRTAAVGVPYLLESNIKLLPMDNIFSLTAMNMLENERNRAQLMGKNATLHYQRYPLSYAVDGGATTAFRSPYNAKQGDFVLVDVLSTFEFNDSMVELVFLVTKSNEQILRKSKYECSSDGKYWLLSPYQLSTQCTKLAAVPESTLGDSDECLVECSVQMPGRFARFFKATACEDVFLPWTVHGVWVRSLLC